MSEKLDNCGEKSQKSTFTHLSNFNEKSESNNSIFANDLSYMFYDCSSLLHISGLSKLNISYTKSMCHMFENCIKLEEIKDFF